MYQALYRKWRPLFFSDVIGQQHITETLRSQLQQGRLSHAYLFSGTRGTGKTTCAKILARAVNCQNLQSGDPCGQCVACRGILEGSVLDVVEIDAASNNGVDNIRDIREETRYAPSSVTKRVYIIDEVHMLSSGAFNALLKTLEEPPEHVLFILATTEIHKVPATILSRCQRFNFRRITPDDIAGRLLLIAQEDHIPLTDDGAHFISRLADGAMRDALSILDRTIGNEQINQETVSQSIGILDTDSAFELMMCIKQQDLSGAVLGIAQAYDSGRDLSGVFDQLLALIRDMLLIKTAKSDISAMLSPSYSIEKVRSLCDGIPSSTLIVWAHVLQEAQGHLKTAANRRIEAELTIVRLCNISGAEYDTLSGRIDALEEKVSQGVSLTHISKETSDITGDKSTQVTSEDTISNTSPRVSQEAVESSTAQSWPLWPKLLTMLAGQINMGALTCLKISARAEYTNDTVIIFCEDDITSGLAKAEPTQTKIREAAAVLLNNSAIKLRILEPGKTDAQLFGGEKLDEVLEKAKALNIKITQI